MTDVKPPREPVTVLDIRSRLRDHVYVAYLNYSFFIKGAVIAAAGLALVAILGSSPHDLPFKGPRLALWGASLGFSMVTIATWSRGAAFTNYRASAFDIILPILMGLLEIVMFVVIAPPIDGLPKDVWVYWYVANACHAFLAVGLVLNRWVLAKPSDYAGDALLNELKHYKRQLNTNMIGAGMIGVFGVVIFLATNCASYVGLGLAPFNSVSTSNWHIAIGFIYVLQAIAIILLASSEYTRLSEL
jgi:hypothetical protein